MSRKQSAFLWVLLLLLAAAGGVWYFRPDLLPARLEQALPNHPSTPALYKYRDDRGQWVIADRPPADGRPYETVRVDPNTNVVPASSIPP